jgi:phage major head subunit gpT-like protein
MDINHANLSSLFKTFSTAFQEGLGVVPFVDLKFLSRDFPSTTASNFYAWLEALPGFREWLGPREFKNVRSQNYEIPNRDWEDSVSMPNKHIKDDTYGVYGPITQMMAEGWPQLLMELVVEVITLNPVCFTSKALFAADHPYGDGNTICNLTGSALSVTTFEAAFAAAANWKLPNGKLAKTRFTHLLHGPKLRSTAFSIVDAEKIVSGGVQVDNPNRNRAIRVELPELAGTYDDYWYLIDSTRPIKLVARQIRETPVPLMDTRPEQVERTGQVDFMASGRAAAGPTFPHLGYAGIL